ncbi:MAG: VOC family protein [Pseudomonadota bacterium]
MANPVRHFEIAGKDDGPLFDFYKTLFGWTMTRHEPTGYGMVGTEGFGIGEMTGGLCQSPDGSNWVTLYIQVADIDKALADVAARGGKTIMEKMSVPNGPTVALFADPAGNTMGLVEPMQPPS